MKTFLFFRSVVWCSLAFWLSACDGYNLFGKVTDPSATGLLSAAEQAQVAQLLSKSADPRVWVQEADRFVADGKPRIAVALLEKALEIAPADGNLRVSYANALLAADQVDVYAIQEMISQLSKQITGSALGKTEAEVCSWVNHNNRAVFDIQDFETFPRVTNLSLQTKLSAALKPVFESISTASLPEDLAADLAAQKVQDLPKAELVYASLLLMQAYTQVVQGTQAQQVTWYTLTGTADRLGYCAPTRAQCGEMASHLRSLLPKIALAVYLLSDRAARLNTKLARDLSHFFQEAYTQVETELVRRSPCLDPSPKLGVIASDHEALLQFFQAANGNTWRNRANWNTNTEVRTWFGVTVTGNRVTGLSLANNNLSGTVLLQLNALTALQNLDLSGNGDLKSPLPNLSGLIALKTLNIRNTGLTGFLPPTWGQLISLENLDLQGLKITGVLPESFGELAALQHMNLPNLGLTGSIPSSLAKLSKLQTLNLSSNQFSGSLPSALSRIKNLSFLDLSKNQLTGEIPAQLSALSNLKTLNLAQNRLTGFIPEPFCKLFSLREMRLEGNFLEGGLSVTIANLGLLQVLTLHDNDLTDLPNLHFLSRLSTLDLRNNRLGFASLVPNKTISGFLGLPQKRTARPLQTAKSGASVTLQSADLAHGNTYQWLRDGLAIQGEIQASLTTKIKGTYNVEVRNPAFSGIVLTSDNITL